MKNSKLITGLSSLSREEIRRFRDYIASPYCNAHPRLLPLFDEIQQFAPRYTDKNLNKTYLCEQLYSGKDFSPQKVLDECSLLYRLLKEFFRDQRIRSRELEGEIYALQALSEKKLDNHYQSEYRRLEKKLISQPYLDETFHWHQYLLAETQNVHFGKKQIRTLDESLGQKLTFLDQHYLAIKLRDSCEALNRQQILNTQFPMELMPEIIAQLSHDNHPYRKVPIIEVYFRIYQALAQPENPYLYEKMVETLEESRVFFSRQEARGMYKYAQNYCIRKINQGDALYEERLFQLYQQLLQNQLILLEGKLAHTDYKNIITLGLKLKAFDWVRTFIENYAAILMEPHSKNALNYGRAAYYAETGETKEAIRLLNQIDYSDIYYQISARLLLVHIYYGNGDTDSLFYQIASFKQFLNRNKEIEISKRKNHLQFLRFARKLARLKEKRQYTAPEKLRLPMQEVRDQLQQTESIVQRSWLMEKLGEIEKGA